MSSHLGNLSGPAGRTNFLRVTLNFQGIQDLGRKRQLQTRVLDKLKHLKSKSGIEGQDNCNLWVTKDRSIEERIRIRALVLTKNFYEKLPQPPEPEPCRPPPEIVWRGQVFVGQRRMLKCMDNGHEPTANDQIVEVTGKPKEALQQLWADYGPDATPFGAGSAIGIPTSWLGKVWQQQVEELISFCSNRQRSVPELQMREMVDSRRVTSCRFVDTPEIKALIAKRKLLRGREAREMAKRIADTRRRAKREWLASLLQKSAEGDFRAIAYFKKRNTAMYTQGSYCIRAGGRSKAIADLRFFYQRKYTPPDPTPPGLPRAIFHARAGPILNPRPFTLEEICDVAFMCKHNKSTGADGISYEALQMLLQSELSEHILDMYNGVLQGLPKSPLTPCGTDIHWAQSFIFLGILIGFQLSCQAVLAARMTKIFDVFITSRWRWLSPAVRVSGFLDSKKKSQQTCRPTGRYPPQSFIPIAVTLRIRGAADREVWKHFSTDWSYKNDALATRFYSQSPEEGTLLLTAVIGVTVMVLFGWGALTSFLRSLVTTMQGAVREHLAALLQELNEQTKKSLLLEIGNATEEMQHSLTTRLEKTTESLASQVHDIQAAIKGLSDAPRESLDTHAFGEEFWDSLRPVLTQWSQVQGDKSLKILQDWIDGAAQNTSTLSVSTQALEDKMKDFHAAVMAQLQDLQGAVTTTTLNKVDNLNTK
ncbi:HYDIN, partial [Symbiodinium necroappetens]